ncbi:ATP-binding protein [Leeia sp. TBRC 13508]|uniref:ATP-binding protein n=1 Tax=Leeia speluncae TaxID=2884804 RepID=A0ABS8D7V1_9NEIS|nr:ATP-binding protein [Leeia speluncae]MCB6184267.1 ATP-binding protein [Leeia speluncae]
MKSLEQMLQMSGEPATREASCELHGQYTSKNYGMSIWTKCPACAAQAAELREQAELRERAEVRQQRWSAMMGQAGIPARFQDRSFANYRVTCQGQQIAFDFAKRYAETFLDDAYVTGRSAIFSGAVGTGKTHLAAAIGMALLSANRTVLYTSVLRMTRLFKQTWERGSQSSGADVVSMFASCDLLILDEVGVQFGSETERNILFDVLNERYENRRPFILLSNLDRKGIQECIGYRVYDRIKEDGGSCVTFDWPSARGHVGEVA